MTWCGHLLGTSIDTDIESFIIIGTTSSSSKSSSSSVTESVSVTDCVTDSVTELYHCSQAFGCLSLCPPFVLNDEWGSKRSGQYWWGVCGIAMCKENLEKVAPAA